MPPPEEDASARTAASAQLLLTPPAVHALETMAEPPPIDPAPFAPEQEEILAEVWVYVGSTFIAKYAIEHGEYTLGRDASCHIPLRADQVSRYHARLTFTAYELVIEDLGSSNGVFIDGLQVQLPTRIRLDQEVQIGTARLFIRLKDAAARQLSAALWDKDLGLGLVRAQLEGQKYKVITTLARGGMGVILQARDLRIRRTVAMKVMKTSNQFSRENVLRFIDEAQLTGQLEHPNIVPVYELGIDEQGETFYSMKFVKGTTLDDVLRGLRNGREAAIEKYPLGALLTIFQKICDAVAFAHSKGIVHRDLKPENVMIGAYGEVLVMDWGLAKNLTGGRREHRLEEVETVAKSALSDDLRGFETMSGLIVGTPPYISPEQARGELEQIDQRSDIYVLGGILYAILTLRPPVEASSVNEVIERLATGRVTHPSSYNQAPRSSRQPHVAFEVGTIALAHCPGRRIPDGLAAVAMKAMQLVPAERYQAVEDLQADIAAVQGGFAPKAERASLKKQLLLFAGRHKREVAIFALFALIVHVLIIGSFIAITRGRARAEASAKLAAARLIELRGTAPTFAAEASSLLEDHKLDEALKKINYAILQVPNEASYHSLRGNILQSLFRFDEAAEAYTAALSRNAQETTAATNLELTRQVLQRLEAGGQMTPETLQMLLASFRAQRRHREAGAIASLLGVDRKMPPEMRRPSFGRRGMRPRFTTNADGTMQVDLSKAMQPDFTELRDRPVTSVNLDDARNFDLAQLASLALQTLSLNRTAVRDLAPLAGMPLKKLSLNGTQITDLTPLRGLPLESLDLSRTGVTDLGPLTASPLRELNLEHCRELQDLRPLFEIPALEAAIIPAHLQDIAYLRAHPGIKHLSHKKLTQPAADFWAEWDAKQ